MSARLKVKRGKTASWASTTRDTTLAPGQIGVEYTTDEKNYLKVGPNTEDGSSTEWSAIDYIDLPKGVGNKQDKIFNVLDVNEDGGHYHNSSIALRSFDLYQGHINDDGYSDFGLNQTESYLGCSDGTTSHRIFVSGSGHFLDTSADENQIATMGNLISAGTEEPTSEVTSKYYVQEGFDQGDAISEAGVIEDAGGNNWYYKKFKSGMAECWRTHAESFSVTTSVGNMYKSGGTTVQLPSSMFSSVSGFKVSAHQPIGYANPIFVVQGPLSTSSLSWQLLSATSCTAPAICLIEVKGFWL